MARPEVVRRGNGSQAPLWKRVRRRWGRTWAGYRLNRRKVRHRRQVGVPEHKQIAFVLGCQRSGTNMLLRTLAQSLDVDRIEESDPCGFVDCRIRDQRIRDEVVSRSTAQCVIFKPICDSHRALELYAEHPGSRGIWVYRHYDDVANSAVRYWGDQSKKFIEDLLEGGGDWGVAQWNREKVTDECLAILADAARDGLSPHGAAALFWYMRNRTFFEQALEDHPGTMLTRYEDLVTDPMPEFERLCAFLGIDFSSEIVDSVFATSVRKHDPPPLPDRIRALCDEMLERLDRSRSEAR